MGALCDTVNRAHAHVVSCARCVDAHLRACAVDSVYITAPAWTRLFEGMGKAVDAASFGAELPVVIQAAQKGYERLPASSM